MKTKGLLLAVQVEGIRTRKDKTLAVTLGTQEVSADLAGQLVGLQNNICAVYISSKEIINEEEINKVDQIDPEFGGKTQSQRLRNVLYVLFEHDSEGFKSFDEFYKAKTEAMIQHFKSKLPPDGKAH